MKRAMLGTLLVLLGTALSGCVAGGPPPAAMLGNIQWPPSEFKHTVATGAIRQYWSCTRPEPNLMRLEGIVANEWSGQPVQYLAWDLVAVDAAGRTLASEQVKSAAVQLATNMYTRFQIDLRTTGGEARFDLYYEYQYQDRGHSPRLAALDWDGPVLMAQQTQRFFVLDACSDTQHLVR